MRRIYYKWSSISSRCEMITARRRRRRRKRRKRRKRSAGGGVVGEANSTLVHVDRYCMIVAASAHPLT